ncbi:MAG: J domain-containing protein [Blastomonas sp.]
MADPYSILGVARGASEKDIKSAYRKLAKELHPDYNKDNPKAAERFSEVTRAYDLLSDKDKRARFDRGEIDMDGNPAMPFGFGGGGGQYRQSRGAGGNAGFSGFGNDGIDFADIFDGLFGGIGNAASEAYSGFTGKRGGAAAKGANVAYRLPVDFVSAATLAPQRITLADGKTIDLKLPDGVESGTQLRLSGKGQAGPGGNGDAIVTIQIKDHPYFRRDGDNVRLDLPITLDEAINGGKVRVPTVDGAVMLTVKPGSSGGRTLRLKGKGFHGKSGARGDQLVTLQIELPENDSDLAKRLEGWKDERDVRSEFGG